MSVLNELCDHVANSLAGTGLTFAIVVWRPGKADSARSIAVQTPKDHDDECPVALATAAYALATTLKP